MEFTGKTLYFTIHKKGFKGEKLPIPLDGAIGKYLAF